jgi:hypothetical protein
MEICRLWRIFRNSKGVLGRGGTDGHRVDYDIPSVEAYREAADWLLLKKLCFRVSVKKKKLEGYGR